MKASKHFSLSEITCRCGCGQVIIDKELYIILEAFREHIGNKRMITHCVNRCVLHNDNVGGVSNSKHIPGKAWDGHVHGLDNEKLHEIAKQAYDEDIISGGLGFYSWGIHIDSGKKRTW